MGKIQRSRTVSRQIAFGSAVAISVLGSVLWAGAARAAPPEPRCVITGERVRLTGLIVKLGAGSIEVSIWDDPVKAVVHGDTVEVEVDGAIAFKAVVKRKIWYGVKHGWSSDSVRVARNTHFIGDRADGDALIGRASLEDGDVLQGDDKEPELAVSPVRVPCAELTLDWDWGDESARPTVAGDGTRWTARTATSLTLHSRPEDRAPGVVLASRWPQCTNCIRVQGIAHRGDWRKVAAGHEGAIATGWVRNRLLERVPDSVLDGYGVACDGRHFEDGNVYDDLNGVIGADGKVVVSRARKRSVRLKAGTPIFGTTEPEEAWATVSHDGVFEVMYADGESWAELVIFGVRGRDAHVRASALIFES